MANVELVIKLPEKYYKAIMKIPVTQSTADMLIIKNGMLLPKGHGRLIDADELIKDYGNPDIEILLENMDTIIEADKDGD